MNSERRVREELKIIDSLSKPADSLQALLHYGIGLSNEHFRNLFMQILARKLEKRWVPVVTIAEKPTASPSLS